MTPEHHVNRLNFLTVKDLVNLSRCAHERSLAAFASNAYNPLPEHFERCNREYRSLLLWSERLTNAISCFR